MYLFRRTLLALMLLTVWSSLQAQPVANFSVGSNNVCSGSAIKFTNSSTGNNLTYQWTFNCPNANSTEKDPTHIFTNTAGADVANCLVTLLVTDQSGLQDSKTMTITVRSNPPKPLLGSTELDGIFFEHCDTIFDLTINNLSENTPHYNVVYDIDWGDGNKLENTSFDAPIAHQYYNNGKLGTDTLWIVAEAANGCTDSSYYYVALSGQPVINFNRETSYAACAAKTESIQLTSNQAVSPRTIYKWDMGDGSPIQTWTADQVGDTMIYTYNYPSCGRADTLPSGEVITDRYIIYLTASNKCGFDLVVPGTVQVFGAPYVNFEIKGDSLYLDSTVNAYRSCELDTFWFINTSASGYGGNYEQGIFCEYEDTVKWHIKATALSDLDTTIEYYCNNEEACQDSFFLIIDKKGTYEVTLVQSNHCDSAKATRILMLGEPPKVDFDIAEDIECYPATVRFVNESDPDIIRYFWDFGDGRQNDSIAALRDPEYLFYEKGEYEVTLQARDPYCWNNADTILVLEKLCQNLYVPNAFIPDSYEEKFRVFKPVASNLVDYQIEIFNTYGQRLWQSTAIEDGRPKDGWNGTYNGQPCPQDTYIWKIEAKIDDGTPGGRTWAGQKNAAGKTKTTGILNLIR